LVDRRNGVDIPPLWRPYPGLCADRTSIFPANRYEPTLLPETVKLACWLALRAIPSAAAARAGASF
jgi:hypothetical protein